MSSSTPSNQPAAACLTPPTAGGIAVVEVIGAEAAAVVNPLLAAKRPIDVAAMSADELRLCRIVDRGEVLDDAIVAARRLADGAMVVDISVHGGTRIVQRVLLALAAGGATIVEPQTLARLTQPTTNLLEAEGFESLARAKTRPVAVWLARAPAALVDEAGRIDRIVAEGQVEAGRSALMELASRFTETRYLLDGIRVVLTGAPNSGKSTLANALAGAEHSIVSPTAGTTRDWVELPAAIEGVPLTLVDTAGIAFAQDTIEQEAIRRAEEQLVTADIVLRVVDRSRGAGVSPAFANHQHSESSGHSLLQRRAGRPPPQAALVWNKCDLPPAPDATSFGEQGGLCVSALTGHGLADIRRWILATARMLDWSHHPARPFTERQYRACLTALATLEAGSSTSGLAHNLLEQGMRVSAFTKQDSSGMV